MGDEVYNMKSEHEKLITWERAFSGWPTRLRICQYGAWTEVFMTWDHEPKDLIGGVDVEVLRKIVAMADALPKVKRTEAGR